MKRIKEIIKDIWRNWKYPLIISQIFNILLAIYGRDMENIWKVFFLLVVNGISIACITYGIIEYFKKK